MTGAENRFSGEKSPEYPIKIDLDIDQDDFISVEILEEARDLPFAKKSAKTSFFAETAVLAVLAFGVILSRGYIAFRAVYVILGFWLLFAANFFYMYFSGFDRQFNMSVNHLLTRRDSHLFFTPEKGEASFWRDRGEYLTNEQRRYFYYSDIRHIKITRHLFIFIMKRSKRKDMNGFAWRVIPKRNMSRETEEDFYRLCRKIEEDYGLTPWTDCRLFD